MSKFYQSSKNYFHLNKNLKFVDIRGNIETRIKKLINNNWDGLIMAKAAINRLNLKINYQEFKVNEMIPAANQGVIGIEVNEKRTDLNDLLELILSVFNKNLSKQKILWSDKPGITIVAASKGYPGEYEKLKEIK